IVSEDCVSLGLRAGAVVFRGLRVGPRGAALHDEITWEAAAIRQAFAGPAAVRALPEVVAFGELLRRAGADPRELTPSLRRLLTSPLQRGAPPAVNNLVDAYNILSVRSRCSLGAHDLHHIDLPVSLRRLSGAEPFTPLGKSLP